jgi:hypothetical protein
MHRLVGPCRQADRILQYMWQLQDHADARGYYFWR